MLYFKSLCRVIEGRGQRGDTTEESDDYRIVVAALRPSQLLKPYTDL